VSVLSFGARHEAQGHGTRGQARPSHPSARDVGQAHSSRPKRTDVLRVSFSILFMQEYRKRGYPSIPMELLCTSTVLDLCSVVYLCLVVCRDPYKILHSAQSGPNVVLVGTPDLVILSSTCFHKVDEVNKIRILS
jgi:hypothetical protein